MKTKVLFLIVFLSFSLEGQETLQANYTFSKEYMTLSEPRVFNAKVVKDQNGTLYTTKVDLSIDPKQAEGYFTKFNDYNFEYKLFVQNGIFYIHDKIGKEYSFKEKIPKIQYQFSNETKEVNGKIFNIATTTFRGRTYVLWYEKGDISLPLWKFVGIPGIVYEAYSTDGNAKWVLESLEKTDDIVVSPFGEETEFLPYTLYPEKAYGLSEELKKMLAQNPNNTMTEQKRTNLEIAFEWE
ncbi:GLPGLI family protein [Flavobacteriaceae bacterium Ap0902]|nr:GLPGLI family protein [Flavobacteriaceae bacterium Ap0902]